MLQLGYFGFVDRLSLAGSVLRLAQLRGELVHGLLELALRHRMLAVTRFMASAK